MEMGLGHLVLPESRDAGRPLGRAYQPKSQLKVSPTGRGQFED